MTRQLRTLYHATITYPQRNRTYILPESHSYDLTDAVYRMMQETRRFPQDNGYTTTFNQNKLTYTVTKFDTLYATLAVRSSDDGIELP